MTSGHPRTHVLYRFFNTDGELLYIGITADPPRRFTEHAAIKAWWAEVANITMEQCDSREDLKRKEFEAIQAEAPRYNTCLKLAPSGECRTLEGAALALQQAREALAVAMEDARLTALAAMTAGSTEMGVAKALNVDRMTVRKWLGKR